MERVKLQTYYNEAVDYVMSEIGTKNIQLISKTNEISKPIYAQLGIILTIAAIVAMVWLNLKQKVWGYYIGIAGLLSAIALFVEGSLVAETYRQVGAKLNTVITSNVPSTVKTYALVCLLIGVAGIVSQIITRKVSKKATV